MVKSYRFPLFLQYSREHLNLTDDQWFAVVLAICLGTEDADAIYNAADKLGALNEVNVAYAELGAISPADAVRIVYERGVELGVANWNSRHPATGGGVPTPFAKVPANLMYLLHPIPQADSIDFALLALVAAYDYQLNHRRDFIKGGFRFSRQLAANALGAVDFEDVAESLDLMVERGVLNFSDGYYRLAEVIPVKHPTEGIVYQEVTPIYPDLD